MAKAAEAVLRTGIVASESPASQQANMAVAPRVRWALQDILDCFGAARVKYLGKRVVESLRRVRRRRLVEQRVEPVAEARGRERSGDVAKAMLHAEHAAS